MSIDMASESTTTTCIYMPPDNTTKPCIEKTPSTSSPTSRSIAVLRRSRRSSTRHHRHPLPAAIAVAAALDTSVADVRPTLPDLGHRRSRQSLGPARRAMHLPASPSTTMPYPWASRTRYFSEYQYITAAVEERRESRRRMGRTGRRRL